MDFDKYHKYEAALKNAVVADALVNGFIDVPYADIVKFVKEEGRFAKYPTSPLGFLRKGDASEYVRVMFHVGNQFLDKMPGNFTVDDFGIALGSWYEDFEKELRYPDSSLLNFGFYIKRGAAVEDAIRDSFVAAVIFPAIIPALYFIEDPETLVEVAMFFASNFTSMEDVWKGVAYYLTAMHLVWDGLTPAQCLDNFAESSTGMWRDYFRRARAFLKDPDWEKIDVMIGNDESIYSAVPLSLVVASSASDSAEFEDKMYRIASDVGADLPAVAILSGVLIGLGGKELKFDEDVEFEYSSMAWKIANMLAEKEE